MIPYKILSKKNYAPIKVSYDVEIDLVNNRLPNKKELSEISIYLQKEHEAEITFVGFYLPEMKIDAGYYASAHHTPEIKVIFYYWSLINTKFEKFFNIIG